MIKLKEKTREEINKEVDDALKFNKVLWKLKNASPYIIITLIGIILMLIMEFIIK